MNCIKPVNNSQNDAKSGSTTAEETSLQKRSFCVIQIDVLLLMGVSKLKLLTESFADWVDLMLNEVDIYIVNKKQCYYY